MQLITLIITSPFHNKSVNMGDFFINISRFEDINEIYGFMLHYYQIHDLLWIYHVYTHTDDQTTSSINFYVKHAHLYNVKHRLNSSAYHC